MYYVYVLQSRKDGKTYTGYTSNVEQRLRLHNSGQVKATKARGPFIILFTESFYTKQEAKKRELWWKSSSGRMKLREFFKSLDRVNRRV